MKVYEQLRTEYEALSDFVAAHTAPFDKDGFMLYTISGALNIWGSYGLYSPSYSEALTAITGDSYSVEQVVTALSCCGDSERELNIPGFFTDMAKKDVAGDTSVSRTFIEMLNSFFVSAAFVNGDFTVEEANALSRITVSLTDYCDRLGVSGQNVDTGVSGKVTKVNGSSYLGRPDQEKKSKDTFYSPNGKKDEPDDDDDDDDNAHININFSFSDTDNDDEDDESKQISDPANRSLKSLLAELDSLVGLDSVKRDIHSLLNFIKVSKLREKRGMKVPVISYHLVFTGNPGTGKTTVARLVAQLYCRMGILPKGQLVETDRSSLVAGYIGQTAIKTQKVIQDALGGVLFIDEAYSLADGSDEDYGKEAIATLLKAMEDHRDELIVIVAGYDDLMHNFINSNPGLASRFSKYFAFPDYCGSDLLRIFERYCESNGYKAGDGVTDMLLTRFCRMYDTRDEHFGNARAVRNMFEKAINCQADRLAGCSTISNADLETITAADIENALKGD